MGYRILGQSAPSATTEQALYTVPPATEAVVSTGVVCNRASTAGTFRISVSRSGGYTGAADYLFYELPIDAYDTFSFTFGMTLSEDDVVRVYASSADMSFALFGQELDA